MGDKITEFAFPSAMEARSAETRGLEQRAETRGLEQRAETRRARRAQRARRR